MSFPTSTARPIVAEIIKSTSSHWSTLVMHCCFFFSNAYTRWERKNMFNSRHTKESRSPAVGRFFFLLLFLLLYVGCCCVFPVARGQSFDRVYRLHVSFHTQSIPIIVIIIIIIIIIYQFSIIISSTALLVRNFGKL